MLLVLNYSLLGSLLTHHILQVFLWIKVFTVSWFAKILFIHNYNQYTCTLKTKKSTIPKKKKKKKTPHTYPPPLSCLHVTNFWVMSLELKLNYFWIMSFQFKVQDLTLKNLTKKINTRHAKIKAHHSKI